MQKYLNFTLAALLLIFGRMPVEAHDCANFEPADICEQEKGCDWDDSEDKCKFDHLGDDLTDGDVDGDDLTDVDLGCGLSYRKALFLSTCEDDQGRAKVYDNLGKLESECEGGAEKDSNENVRSFEWIPIDRDNACEDVNHGMTVYLCGYGELRLGLGDPETKSYAYPNEEKGMNECGRFQTTKAVTPAQLNLYEE